MEIDVSKCYYYNADNSPFCCELYDNECEAQNCYFQQLQQLKAENKELKEVLNKIGEICQNEIINLTDSCVNGGRYFKILQIIKEVK